MDIQQAQNIAHLINRLNELGVLKHKIPLLIKQVQEDLGRFNGVSKETEQLEKAALLDPVQELANIATRTIEELSLSFQQQLYNM